MNERMIVLHTYLDGTLSGDHTIADEFPFPVTLRWAKASQSNDGSATLAAEDESGNAIIAAAAIGDSADMAELTPSAAAVAAGYDQLAQDKRIVWTLDYDGASGTAADNVNFLRGYLAGESA